MGVQSTNAVTRRVQRAPASAGADYIPIYHLDVVGTDSVDLVGSAGGWLFDRVMAGWDVQVTLTRDCDLRPLRILGVRTEPRPSGPPIAVALAASAQALLEAPTLCGDVAAALRRGRAEVTVWGAARLTALDSGARPVLPVQHVLSAAARAFKSQALAAAGLERSRIGVVETFRTGNRSLLLVPPDLSPV